MLLGVLFGHPRIGVLFRGDANGITSMSYLHLYPICSSLCGAVGGGPVVLSV